MSDVGGGPYSAPPMSIKEIADKAVNFDYNPLIALRYWLRTADTLLKEVRLLVPCYFYFYPFFARVGLDGSPGPVTGGYLPHGRERATCLYAIGAPGRVRFPPYISCFPRIATILIRDAIDLCFVISRNTLNQNCLRTRGTSVLSVPGRWKL